jgi:Zn ribbon nucleic-acid-binding protein
MSKEIDHECTPEIVCPHCGDKKEENLYRDDFGVDDTIEGRECDECGNAYDVKKSYITIYTTKKIEKESK